MHHLGLNISLRTLLTKIVRESNIHSLGESTCLGFQPNTLPAVQEDGELLAILSDLEDELQAVTASLAASPADQQAAQVRLSTM